MFDKNSDYAHNKRADAIVYISVTGIPAILTRADFSSEEEFQKWKRWSDGDYKTAEHDGRDFYDNCVPLDERLDGGVALASVEDDFIRRLEEPERRRARVERSRQIKAALTEKQYRRLWMYHMDGKNERGIALIEKVSQQGISLSITGAIKKLRNFLRNLSD